MRLTKTTPRMLSGLGMWGSILGIAAPEAMEKNAKLKLLTADVSSEESMTRLRKVNPYGFLNVGIAEQDLIGIAGGLSMEGYCTVSYTYASFVLARCYEQIRQYLSNMQLDMKVIGASAGLCEARAGLSHWAIEDIAVARALPNVMVFSPADALEALLIAQYAMENKGPMYIRLTGGANCPIVYPYDYNFDPLRIDTISKGSDVAILATGLMVHESIQAAAALEKEGISCSVFNVHTIKPLDTETLDQIFAEHRLIVTVEEHNIIGGLGGAVAEHKATRSGTPRQVFIGVEDRYSSAGSLQYMFETAGLSSERIAERIRLEYQREIGDRT